MTDNELRFRLSRISEGDMNAFEEVYTDMKTPVMTVIMRIVKNRETAEEILQDVFVKLYFSPPTDIEKPRAYIFKTASNSAIDELRKIKQTVSFDECESEMYSADADSGDKVDVEQALGRLDIKNRQIVTLHVNGGLKFREIAEIVGMPLGTVLWRYRKALGELREYLR